MSTQVFECPICKKEFTIKTGYEWDIDIIGGCEHLDSIVANITYKYLPKLKFYNALKIRFTPIFKEEL